MVRIDYFTVKIDRLAYGRMVACKQARKVINSKRVFFVRFYSKNITHSKYAYLHSVRVETTVEIILFFLCEVEPTFIYIGIFLKNHFHKKKKLNKNTYFTQANSNTLKKKSFYRPLFYGSMKNTRLSPSEFSDLYKLVNNLEFLTARPSSGNTIGPANNSLLQFSHKVKKKTLVG